MSYTLEDIDAMTAVELGEIVRAKALHYARSRELAESGDMQFLGPYHAELLAEFAGLDALWMAKCRAVMDAQPGASE